MTKEEASEIIIRWLNKGKDGKMKERLGYLEGWFHDKDEEAFNMAIKALSQEPCDDAISRQAVKTELKNCEVVNVYDENDNFVGYYNADTVDSIVRNLPSVRPQERKTGRWIEEDMFDGEVAYRCSECNELFWIESGTPKDNGYNFCPKCGKRLVEPQESEERNDKI